MPYKLVKPKIDLRVRKLCKSPYHGHPKGCPNYNKKKGCPPNSLIISKILKLDEKIYAIWSAFNFAKHRQRMKRLHPSWSQRQIECCLYWQNKARKSLQIEIARFKIKHHDYLILECPESHGIDVTHTMKRIGIELEWPPVYLVYQIAIAGESKNAKKKRKRNYERII